MHTHILSVNRRQSGFSLPEIMVGMVIGLLGIIIIMQVTSVFEGQKRTTTGGSDAQNGAAIALYTLQRDVSQTGYGFSSTNILSIAGVPRTFVTPYVVFPSMASVMVSPNNLNTPSANQIVHDPETDYFIVIYGNSNTTTEGAVVVNSTPATYTIIGGAETIVAGTGGHNFMIGDWVTVDDGTGNGGAANTHYLYQVSGVVDAVTVPVLLPGVFATAYNAPPILQDSAAGPHPVLYNLGQTPSILVYAVQNGSLSVCDFLKQDCTGNAAVWNPLAGGIVSMRTQCIGGSALRIALVARNSQPAGTVVSTVPTWNPNGITTPVAVVPATLTSWASSGVAWDHYRYKTFETIIPLRNAAWTGVKGC